ncbi:hypothetical protein PSO31014_04386 [Pandoraea soli]|uniref:Immunity protein n=1 Tax=Pandoraea soli TaxID=2508293 RepID=A0ABY6WAB6_9BURK|nr:hypothetical protein PSO31014_04386 [Pandoraea soli]
MIKIKDIIQILIFIIYLSASLSLLTLSARFFVAIYFLITHGEFYFSSSNFTYSIKAGTAAGIPLGFGIWILGKINKRNHDK